MIQNIIFDAGGVIVGVDLTRSIDAFKKLGADIDAKDLTQNKWLTLFNQFEIGGISSANLRQTIKQSLNLTHITDQEFDQAWNSILLDIAPQKLELIKTLKTQYKTFLLSNTNEIHLKAFFEILKRDYGQDNLQDYFDKEYYSCQMGLRKPNEEAFEFVLKTSHLIPNKTLFIDDSQQFVEAANKLGIHGIHFGSELQNFFDIPMILSSLS